MVESNRMIIIDEEGSRGTILGKHEIKEGTPANLVVELGNGDQILVPWDEVVRKENGYYLAGRFADMGLRHRETGRVRITKTIHEREEMVDESLVTEKVQVRRVAINRLVDGPVEERQEGDTLIIPVVEEEAVIQKRLVLKEEIHITKQRKEEHHSQQVTLRRQEVNVERMPNEEEQKEAVHEN